MFVGVCVPAQVEALDSCCKTAYWVLIPNSSISLTRLAGVVNTHTRTCPSPTRSCGPGLARPFGSPIPIKGLNVPQGKAAGGRILPWLAADITQRFLLFYEGARRQDSKPRPRRGDQGKTMAGVLWGVGGSASGILDEEGWYWVVANRPVE